MVRNALLGTYDLEPVVIEEFDNVLTVGDIRRALAGVADDMPVCDGMGEPLLVSIYRPQIRAAYVEVQ